MILCKDTIRLYICWHKTKHKLHHSTRQWLSVISYILDDGFSRRKPKLSLYLWVPVEHFWYLPSKHWNSLPFWVLCYISMRTKFVTTGDIFLLSWIWLVTTFFCSQNHGTLLHVTRPLFRIWVRDYRVTRGTTLRDLSHGYLMGWFCISRPLGPSWVAFMLVKLM